MAGICKATNIAGKPCQAEPRRNSEFCVWHDPALAERRKEWSGRGGANKSNERRAMKRLKRLELEDVDAALCGALLDVLAGTLEPGIGTAAAGIARAIAQLRTGADHEQRIAELEARLAERKEGRTA